MNVSLDMNFLTGMIKEAVAQGLDPETVAYVHGRVSILMQPHVKAGFDRYLQNCNLPVKKATLAMAMRPSVLAAAVEHTINESGNPLCDEMRKWIPEHQELTEIYKEAANQGPVAPPPDFLTRFERMKLSDKIALLAGTGAAAGGAYSMLKPSPMDEAYERGPFTRTSRGAIQGASTSAGAGLGAVTGNFLADRLGNPSAAGKPHPLAMLLGAGMGGMAGHQLSNSVL